VDEVDLLRRRRALEAEAAEVDAALAAGGVTVPPIRPAARPGAARPAAPPRLAGVLVLALVVGAGGWLVYKGGVRRQLWSPVAPAGPKAPTDPSAPPPVVTPDVAAIRDAAAAYRADFAKAHGDLADRVEAGDVTNLDGLVEAVKAARALAARPLVRAQDDFIRSKCDAQGNVTDKKAVAGALRAVRAGLSGGN
jgi:hypothetical protein